MSGQDTTSTAPTGAAPIRIGALAPLSPPGWVTAGRHLLAGIELGVRDVNADAGIGGRPLELTVRDTAADPRRAEQAMAEFASLGVVAVVGEYHSVVARAAAAKAVELELPFLCSSAVLDQVTDDATDWVARIAPAQSHGWQIYANHLLESGHSSVAVVTQPSTYWAAGRRILRAHLEASGGGVVELDLGSLAASAVADALAGTDATALLLLVGHPEPAVSIVRAVRRDARLSDVLIGAPAGQPEFADWARLLGDDGSAIPFLRYLPDRLGSLGSRVEATLTELLGEPPSFVAFEGYDTVAVVADLLRSTGTQGVQLTAAWSRASVHGTRGEIGFGRVPGVGVWQWAWPPVQVVDRDPGDPDQFRVLRQT